jgi:polar amino acid transport system substrate-binding protein
VLLSIGLSCAAAPAQVTIGVPEPNTLASMAQAVLRVAYARLGMDFVAQELPLRRALSMASSGEIDGDLMRANAVFQDNPALLQVRVPVAVGIYAAYRRGECPARVSIGELAQYRVAYFRGIRAIEMALPQQSLVATNNSWDVLRLLQHNIADYALGMQTETDALLASREVQGICRVSEPVIVQPLYHALHKRHAQLLPKLEAVLADMEKKGEISRIWGAEERLAPQERPANAPARSLASTH